MRVRRIVIVAALATALVAGLAAAVTLTRAQAGHPGCADIRAYQERYGQVETISRGDRSLTVLGDSYSAGDTLGDRGQRWVDVLAQLEPDLSITVDAVGSTGFANPGLCGEDAFRDRIGRAVAHSDDALVVQGGINDTVIDPAALERAVTDVLDEAAAVPRVAVIGPIDAPATHGEERIDDLLAREAAERGMTYVPTLRWELPFGPDRLHLTSAGHHAYAERVRAELAAAGVL